MKRTKYENNHKLQTVCKLQSSALIDKKDIKLLIRGWGKLAKQNPRARTPFSFPCKTKLGGFNRAHYAYFSIIVVYDADQINGAQLFNARKWEYRSFLWQRLNNKIRLINTTTSLIGNIDHPYLDCCDPPRIGFFSSCYINFRPIRKVWIIICSSRSPGRNFLAPFSNFLVLSLRHYIDNCMHACVGKRSAPNISSSLIGL